MNFTPVPDFPSVTPSFQAKLERLKAIVDEHLIPLESLMLAGNQDALEGALAPVKALMKKEGFWLPQVPKDFGGQGFSLYEHGLISEQLGRSMLGHVSCNCQAPDAGNMEVLIERGTPAQQDTFLKPLLTGEIRSAFAMTEPEHAGSNPVIMSTRAVRDGDDYVINGHKWYTTGADGAAFFIVMAVTDPEAAPHEAASQILVPADTKGYRHIRNIAVMGETCWGHNSHAEIEFKDVRVPVSNLIGKEGEGFKIAQQRLGPGRIHHCMRWLGICSRAFELAARYAANRQLTHTQVLGDQQAIQFWLAEMRAEIESARLLVLDTAARIDREGQYAVRNNVSMIKFHTAGVLQRTLDRALQIHGALGMCDDTPIAFWYRHERAARIYDGPDETHKRAFARRLMKEFE
ncbi:MAG: acyl-CoA dehydrogenase family protein [Aliidiomarina sp.]|uniref:acyl-CoA dehydrogenase family protein n=1 Tax=Aliidiomarina sp. TaxID=1872439 RepID=UPI0025BECE79|nr:acyl-CoA dehydrogenase family protein [Aliidiomarina sp.]MCH8501197.1 acyl-CoA dehydrogenase family protein [Aliidiomarina sp.]